MSLLALLVFNNYPSVWMPYRWNPNLPPHGRNDYYYGLFYMKNCCFARMEADKHSKGIGKVHHISLNLLFFLHVFLCKHKSEMS